MVNNQMTEEHCVSLRAFGKEPSDSVTVRYQQLSGKGLCLIWRYSHPVDFLVDLPQPIDSSPETSDMRTITVMKEKYRNLSLGH